MTRSDSALQALAAGLTVANKEEVDVKGVEELPLLMTGGLQRKLASLQGYRVKGNSLVFFFFVRK